MQYWALINNVKVGPLSPEQILALGATPETLVWTQGLQQWVPAANVAEFGFSNTSRNNTYNLPPCPDTYFAWAIVLMLMCCLPAGIVAVIYSSSVESRYSRGDYEGALKASNNAKIWCIVSIVLGLIGAPAALFSGMPFNWFI